MICNVFFTIESCDAAKKVSGWIVYAEVAKKFMFLLYSLQVQDEQPDTLQHNGMTNYEMEICM